VFVLLAEDNPANRSLAELQLKRLGHEVFSVLNGRECVAEMLRRADAFDLILMDCNMPIMDGYAATGEIRKREEKIVNGRRIPIIAMTANVMEGDREVCIMAGMDDYLPKPVSQQALREMMDKWQPRR
jgi:two-component system, sensor histidine kinase and response regulator